MITTKKSINAGVKSMAAKAMSYSQVCKQMSGIGGKIAISDTEKVYPLQLMQSLGVHVRRNSYKPADIIAAWRDPMMKDGKLHIMRSIAYIVVIDGKEYTLCTEKEGVYKQVSHSILVPLVSAADKVGKNDVVVNVQNILRGLQQNVFITDTMAKIQKSAEMCAALKSGFVNVNTKQAPIWVRVEKSANGWTFAPKEEKKEVASEARAAAKKSTKKSGTTTRTKKVA